MTALVLSLSTTTETVTQNISATFNIVTASNGTPPYTFTQAGLPYGYNMTSGTGSITGSTSTTGTFSVSVTAHDSTGTTDTKSFTLNVGYHQPVTHNVTTTINYNSVANPITLLIDYAYTSVAIGYANTLHGIPTVSGTTVTYTPVPGWNGIDYFTYKAIGPGGTSNFSNVYVTITNVSKVTPTVTSGYLARGITSVPINPVTFGATGGQAPYTISLSGNLPTGLNFSSGTISGTPTVSGYFNFALTTTDSSFPTPVSTVTNYSINVLSLSDVANISTTQKSSKYSKTSDYWNKTPLTVTPQTDWDQWGLYRSYIGANSIGWGSDSIQNTNGTVDIPYSGSNVDVIVIAVGSPDPNHPEFAVNSDGTGGSRVKYYNWLADTGGQYSDNGYRNHNANAAAAVTSIVAGNTYGWARNSNIYSIDLSLMFDHGTLYETALAGQMISAFSAVAKFHSTKLPNPVTGLQNPTIVICNQTLTWDPFVASGPSGLNSFLYQNTAYLASAQPGGFFSTATLASYHINSPFTSLSTSTSYRNNTTIYRYDPDVYAAVQRCTNLPGLVFVGGAGDYQGYVDTGVAGNLGPDYNDALPHPTRGTVNYARGASPSNAGINVGAADSTAIEQIATYSATGPGVNLYAPGTDIMAAFNSDLGVTNPYYTTTIPTVQDPRNSLYSIGKVSGTAYAAAQVAGFLACLAQVTPNITQASALSYLKNNAGVNQLSTATNTATNLYLFGKFPVISEQVTSSLPAVATNQPFSITINNGVSNGAFYVKGTDVLINTYNLNNGTIGNNVSGTFTLTNQVFTTPGVKTYDFYFANTTDRVSLSVEVVAQDATKIISSYTQNSKLWNKAHDYIPVENDWLSWGLLRSSTTTNAINWGSDSVINNTSGTVTVPYSGLNVDIVVIDSASINPDHPEFALYSDGTGGSRVKYYNWLTGTGTYPTSDDYTTTDANRVSAIAGIAAGNIYGWARAANIYSVNYKKLPSGPQAAEAFTAVTNFHNAKGIDPVTGYKRPTIIIAGWSTTISLAPGGTVHYQGTDHSPVYAPSVLNQYGLIEPYADLGIDYGLYLNARDPSLDTAVSSAIAAGIIVVSTPGDVSAYCAKDSGDTDHWNNYYRPSGTLDSYYYHRGASPGAATGVICVGALDSEVEQHKALYSGNGPRVDLFAPGSDLMSAMSNSLGTVDLRLNSNTPTIADHRNNNFYVGKVSGTAYAAANVAGYLACLLQVYPTLTPTTALNTVTQYSSVDQLTINIEGYGVNRDLNGANNLLLYSVFPDYNEEIVTTVYNSTVTSVALGEYFDIVITNGDPYSYFTYTGSKQGRGQLDANGSVTINDFAVANKGEYVYKFYFPLTNHTYTLKFKVTQAGDVSSSNIIHAGDFDRLQNRVSYLIHDVYGKQPFSSTVTNTAIVTATSWTNLYKDIESTYIHQHNHSISLLDVSTGTRVTSKEVNALTLVIDDLINNFDNADPQQMVLSDTLYINTTTNNVYDTYSRTYHWTTSTAFPSVARNFFNLGGYVEINFENPTLGNQTAYFTLTDYINQSGSISLPIPGGNVVSTLLVQGINGNTATIQTIVAPNLGNTALATGTVKLYVSTDATGGIAGPTPNSISNAPLAQGQLLVNPISQYITLTGNSVVTYPFTIHNTSPTDITVSEINVINDIIFTPLQTTINSALPVVVPAGSYSTATISFQNVTPGGQPGLYNNSIQLISNGPNPILNVAVPILTKFGITVSTNPINLSVTRATTATILPTSYAGTITSFSGIITAPATGFQLINPGSNYTYFTLDDTPGKLTMGLLLAKEFFSGLRIPSTTGALKSPYVDPILIVDVASIPNKTTSTQITYTAYNGSNIGTYTTTVNVTPNVVDEHLGDWISPKNFPNGVIGFSYDIINGERCLTYGFGMGGGGSSQLYYMDKTLEPTSYSLYGAGLYSDYSLPQLGLKFQSNLTTATATAALTGWNTGTDITTVTNWNTTSQTLSYPVSKLVELSTGTNYNPFLQTYGVWSSVDSSATTFISSGTFLARDQGDYNYYLNIDRRLLSGSTNTASNTATVTIDGIQIAITTTNTILSGSVTLTPGLHNIVVTGLLKPSTNSTFVITHGAMAAAITDYTGYTVWSTLDVMPPTWAEVGRIRLIEDGNPHQYQIPTNIYTGNIAAKTSYSTYFKNNSIVTVNDNGVGQLTISLNPVVAAATDSVTNATLVNVPYLFYYASAAENQTTSNKRYNNYQTVGQYVQYFTGFDRYGKVTTKNVLSPGYIAPPTIIQAHYAQFGDERSWWQKFFSFVGEAVVTLAVVVVGLYLLSYATALIVYGPTATLSFIEFLEFASELFTCFTGDAEVTMADGTNKKIKDVQAGEYVYNHNKTKLNKVKYVEVTVNKEMIGLYSPDKDIAPFATLNHPLYVNGLLSSIAPNEIYKAYPWLGMTSQLKPERSGPMHPGELMYNLYLDGDNTYIVNGYGTNSIIGDGGALRVAMENGYLTQDRVQEMFNEYIEAGTEVAFGGYLFNKYFGKVLETIKFKFVVKLAAKAFDQPTDSKFRKIANKVFEFIGKQAIKRQQKQLKK